VAAFRLLDPGRTAKYHVLVGTPPRQGQGQGQGQGAIDPQLLRLFTAPRQL
jgi:hypothetical protein